MFFQKLFQVLKTGEAVKGRMISEDVLTSEIIARLSADDRAQLKFLAMSLNNAEVSLKTLEVQIKNQFALFSKAESSISTSSTQQDVIPSESFFVQSRLTQSQHVAFFGAQTKPNLQRSKRNFEHLKFDKLHSNVEKKTNDRTKRDRIPPEEWATWSQEKRRR